MWVFLAAFGASLLILLLHRRVLPAMGIVIGNEDLTGRQRFRAHRRESGREQKKHRKAAH
jgi:hypothetical protein